MLRISSIPINYLIFKVGSHWYNISIDAAYVDLQWFTSDIYTGFISIRIYIYIYIYIYMYIYLYNIIYIMIINLVGGIPTPLKNMTSSVGMMKFPTDWNVIKLYSQLLGRGPGYCISDPKTRVFLGVT